MAPVRPLSPQSSPQQSPHQKAPVNKHVTLHHQLACRMQHSHAQAEGLLPHPSIAKEAHRRHDRSQSSRVTADIPAGTHSSATAPTGNMQSATEPRLSVRNTARHSHTPSHPKGGQIADQRGSAAAPQQVGTSGSDDVSQQQPGVDRANRQFPSPQPRSASPNSYLANSGRAAAAQPSSAAKSGNAVPPRSSSAPRAGLSSRNRGMSAAQVQATQHGKVAAGKGRLSSSAGSPKQGKAAEAREAQPSFIQTLRDWGLGPVESGPLTQPMWQPYIRHVTPERDSARSALARRALAQKALALQSLSVPVAAATSSDSPQHRTLRHRAPGSATQAQQLRFSSPHTTDRSSVTEGHGDHSQSSDRHSSGDRTPWNATVRDASLKDVAKGSSPISHVTARDRNPSRQEGARGNPLVPSAFKPSLSQLWSHSSSQQYPSQNPGQPLHPSAPQSGTRRKRSNISSSDAMSQPGGRPFRAGQLATAALQTKQAAWEHTRTHSLPSLLSQVTELLHCNSEPLLLVPERSATQLMHAAAPQLGQPAPQLGPPVPQLATAAALHMDTTELLEAAEVTAGSEAAQHEQPVSQHQAADTQHNLTSSGPADTEQCISQHQTANTEHNLTSAWPADPEHNPTSSWPADTEQSIPQPLAANTGHNLTSAWPADPEHNLMNSWPEQYRSQHQAADTQHNPTSSGPAQHDAESWNFAEQYSSQHRAASTEHNLASSWPAQHDAESWEFAEQEAGPAAGQEGEVASALPYTELSAGELFGVSATLDTFCDSMELLVWSAPHGKGGLHLRAVVKVVTYTMTPCIVHNCS